MKSVFFFFLHPIPVWEVLVQGNLAFYYWACSEASDMLCEIKQTQKASSPLCRESKRLELTEVGGCLGSRLREAWKDVGQNYEYSVQQTDSREFLSLWKQQLATMCV